MEERGRKRGQKMQGLATHHPHSTVLPCFVDERWARHFAGVASTTIAHKVRIWALEDSNPSTATATARDRVEALYLIRKSARDEDGSGFFPEEQTKNRKNSGGGNFNTKSKKDGHSQNLGKKGCQPAEHQWRCSDTLPGSRILS